MTTELLEQLFSRVRSEFEALDQDRDFTVHRDTSRKAKPRPTLLVKVTCDRPAGGAAMSSKDGVKYPRLIDETLVTASLQLVPPTQTVPITNDEGKVVGHRVDAIPDAPDALPSEESIKSFASTIYTEALAKTGMLAEFDEEELEVTNDPSVDAARIPVAPPVVPAPPAG